MEEDFLHIFTKEFFYVLPVIMEKLTEAIPKEIDILNVKITDISFKDFDIDPARASFDIDEKNHGMHLKWAKLNNYQFHCHVRFGILLFIAVNWDIDVYLKDVILDNGFTLTADPHTGAPHLNLYSTSLDLGNSYYRMSGNFIMWLISLVTDFLLKYPLQVIIDLFLQPGANFLINYIIIPDFLGNGFYEIPGFLINGKQDSLVVDFTQPQNPLFDPTTVDTFIDGTIYFKNEGRSFPSPTTPMRFQSTDYTLQMVLSSYSANQAITSVLQTGLISLPVEHTLIKEFVGLDLTTTLLLVIVPELFYTFGDRYLNLQFTPQIGTELNFSNDNKSIDATISTLADFVIVNLDNSTQLGF